MPTVGAGEVVLVAVYVFVVISVITLPIVVMREMRRRGEQLDRIERRLDLLERTERRDG